MQARSGAARRRRSLVIVCFSIEKRWKFDFSVWKLPVSLPKNSR
jgi:hypothetical protein